MSEKVFIPYSDKAPYFPWAIEEDQVKSFANLVRPMIRTVNNTPDLPHLNMSNFHYVFVYGTLKRRYANHDYLSRAKFVCPAWTELNCFRLYQTKGKVRYPVAIIKDSLDNQAKGISGELFRVDVPTMRNLDFLEQNGEMYKRYRFAITLGDQYQGQKTRAWMYVGIKRVWEEDIEKGNLGLCASFQRSKPPKQTYYTFTNL